MLYCIQDTEPPRNSIGNDLGPIVLGGSWVVVNGAISRVIKLISHIRGLITPLITTHEPPSKCVESFSSCLPAPKSPCTSPVRPSPQGWQNGSRGSRGVSKVISGLFEPGKLLCGNVGVSENRGPQNSTLKSRILIIRTLE